MSNDGKFSVASAQRAADQGRLAEWVVGFLASPGSSNSALAAAFALSGATYLGQIRFPLDRLTPMAGPVGDEVVVPVAEGIWEHDVEAMEHSIEEGWHPPPLLVSYHDGRYFLEDGNHRYASLRRAGATHAWVVLLFADEVERHQYLRERGHYLNEHEDLSTKAGIIGLADSAKIGAGEGCHSGSLRDRNTPCRSPHSAPATTRVPETRPGATFVTSRTEHPHDSEVGMCFGCSDRDD